MARPRLTDLLQSYPFWLLDIDPSGVFPFFVLGSPRMAFSSISAPEITINHRTIRPLNGMWDRSAPESAEAGSITLERGVRWEDGSFYSWADRTLKGDDVPHRNLLLVQYTGMGSDLFSGLGVPDIAGGGVEIVRIPGKLWVLWQCLPGRYKAGSDFDAKSSDVSVMSLEVKPMAISEIAMGI